MKWNMLVECHKIVSDPLLDRILFGLDECKTTVGQTDYRTL